MKCGYPISFPQKKKFQKLKNKDKVLVHLGDGYCFQTPWEKYSFQNFQVMKSKKQINIQKSYKL